MGFNLPILKLDMTNIGLIPRHRANVINSFANSKVNCDLIQKDENGEYTLLNPEWRLKKKFTKEYYDGEHKILTVDLDSENLQINIFTKNQVNLFFDIEVNTLSIHSSCPICIDGKIKIRNLLNVEAKALCFLDEVISDTDIELTTLQGIGLFSTVRSKNLSITTGYLYFADNIDTKRCDITSQAFQQVTTSKINTDTLRLISAQSEIFGNVIVNDSCFLAVSNFLIGDGKHTTTIKFPATHYIHSTNILLNKKSEFLINADCLEQITSRDKQEKSIIIDETLFIDKYAVAKFNNSQIYIDKAQTRGELSFNVCEIRIGFVIIQKNRFLLSNTKLIGNKIDVLSGSLIIENNCQIKLEDSLLADNKTNLMLNKSKICVAKKIVIFGRVDIVKSEILTVSFVSYVYTNIKKTKIESLNMFELQGYISLHKASIKSQIARFAGVLNIFDTYITAKNLDYESRKGSMRNNFVRADIISINGGIDEDSLKFYASRLVFKILIIKNRVDIQRSSLIGVNNGNICHDIEGSLVLNKSQFITESGLNSLIGSNIELCKYSKILSGIVNSKGNISIEESTIYCDVLSQEGSAITSSLSNVIIKQFFTSDATDITLSDGSQLFSTSIRFINHSNMCLKKDSILGVKEQSLVDSSSYITSQDSAISTNIFVCLGRAELIGSLLTAQDILIYNQFTATDKSIVNASKNISLAESSDSKVKCSMVKSKNIDAFGKLAIHDSGLQAEEELALWSTSSTNIQGQTSLNSQDFTLRGALTTSKKSQKEVDELTDSQSKPIIQAINLIHISHVATIAGNESLVINADVITQLGQIILEADLCSKGRKFYNLGKVKAKTIFLGFDDLVISHGIFSSNSMTVHSSLINIFGQIYARESLSSSGIAGLNILGIISANNYVNNSFISLNVGVLCPNLYASPRYIFSITNIASAAKIIAIACLPAHAYTINLISMVPGLFSTVTNLLQLSNKLNWQTIKAMHRHEYIPILCQLKNAFMFGYGAFTAGSALSSSFSTISSNFNKMVEQPGAWASEWQTSMQTTDWLQIGLRTAGALAGSYADTSLLHINLGVSIAANSINTNLQHLNLGFEHSLFLHSVNTYSLYNRGYSSGLESSFSATNVKNSGTLAGARGFRLTAHKVENDDEGVIKGNKASVSVDELSQNGLVEIEDGQVEINRLVDSEKSKTNLSHVMLSGSSIEQHGEHIFKDVYITETDRITSSAESRSNLDNVTIETIDFVESGKITYEHTVVIKAKTTTFSSSSVINGKKTDDEKLFVTKEDTNDSTEITVTETVNSEAESLAPTGPDKEFNPQHMLFILSDKVDLQGRLTGGDYTQIRGSMPVNQAEEESQEVPACEELVISESANIDLKYGSIAAKKSSIYGKIKLDGFSINIGKAFLSENAQYTLQHSSFIGQDLESAGVIELENSVIQVDTVNLTTQSKVTLIHSGFTSQQLVDEGIMQYQGQSGVIADSYTHTGHIQKLDKPEDDESRNLFYIQAKSARLNGSGDIDSAFYDIEHLSDGAEFVAGRGKYSLYMTSENLAYSTHDAFDFSGIMQRDCDLQVQASRITFNSDYSKQHDLRLISTEGDISFTANVQVKNLYAKSATKIMHNSALDASSILSFEAENGYYNYGGILTGDVIAVKAGEIIILTPGSVATSWHTSMSMGGTGIISARSKLFLESTKINIENYGGIIRAGDYTQLLAAQDVVNICNERSYQGAYDTIKEFDGGLISGGNGSETEGIGLYIKAQGCVISDASDFISNGSNYIEGVKGVSFGARQHTYVSLDTTKKTWYGKKTHIIETSTNVRGSVVHSNAGRNIIQSGEGEVTSIITRFSSPGGTDVYAKGNVKLFSLQTQNHHFEYRSNFWGLKKSERDYIYQSSTPTLFIDNGSTRVSSAEGNVDARGAYFIGNGDLYIQAKGRIQFGLDILNISIIEKRRAFDISIPCLNAWNTYKQGGSAWDIITAEDATLSKLSSLSNSHNAAELLASSISLGIDLANTSNSLMRGLGQGSLSNELLARYGLGGANGFSPTVTLSMIETKTTTHFQTLSEGGVNRGGNVKLAAGEGIDLENGVRIHAGGNIEVDSSEIIAHAASLNSSVNQSTMNESVSISMGNIQSVGASYSQTKTTSTNYVNAELSADGNVFLHNQDGAMRSIELDGANIIGDSLDAKVDTLVIIDRQDISSTQTKSYSLSTNGQFSIFAGKGHDKTTQKQSGIHVIQGINTDGHIVQVDETYMEGGTITTNGENHFTTSKLVSVSVQDERQYRGIGVSGNLTDLNRFVGGKPTNIAGEQVIATAVVTLDSVDYAATQKPVIYGEQGTSLDIKTLDGEIHTSSSNGKAIRRDDEIHLELDIPITNKDYLDTFVENVDAGKEKLTELFSHENIPHEPMDFGKPEPIKPIEEDSEENDKEQQNIETVDSDLPIEITQEDIDETLECLQSLSPDEKEALDKAILKAQEEKANFGEISPETENTLTEQITAAVIKTLKVGSEVKLEKLIEKLGPEYEKKLIRLLSNPETLANAGVKLYLGTKGVLFTFTCNLALASLDKEVTLGDEVKHASVLTSVELSFGAILKFGLNKLSMGELVGPFSWGLVIFDVLDSFYDDKQVEQFIEQGLANLEESQTLYRSGHPFYGWAVERAAADKIGSAARAQAGHILGDLTTSVAKKIEPYFDSKKQQKTTKVTTVKNVSEYHWSFFNSPSTRMPEYEVHNPQGKSHASY